MNGFVNFLADNAFLTMLATNIIQAVAWAFAFKKRRIENDTGEASALDSIRELNNKIAADLKEKYEEQHLRISDLENREREAIKERGELTGQITVLSQQHKTDKELIQRLTEQVTSYKAEIASWRGKFENLQKQFNQFKKEAHEK